MSKHIHTIAGATVAGAILGATVLGGATARTADASTWRTPLVDPPVTAGYPPSMDPPAQPDPGAELDDLLAKVSRLVGSLDPACVPPDRPDAWNLDPAEVALSSPCNVATAASVASPGAVAVASQTQYAPLTQTAGAG
jgi:hypothetical protein